MKRLIVPLLALLIPFMMSAQAQITTKKAKISDFTVKTTQVVLTGNTFYDTSLRDEICATWKVSPYEFCTTEEFESMKGQDDFYFLLTVSGQFRKEKEPGIDMLSLVKGGKGAGSIDDMLEVITIPLRSTEDPSGREFMYLPVLLEIMQEKALAFMEKDINTEFSMLSYNNNLKKAKGHKFYIAEEDLDEDFLESGEYEKYLSDHMVVCEADDVDEKFEEMEENAIVSYTIAPEDEVNGSYCYKMLIGCDDHKIYMFKKHRIGARTAKGFLAEDLRKIATVR